MTGDAGGAPPYWCDVADVETYYRANLAFCGPEPPLALDDLRPVLELPGSFIDLSYMDNGLEIARWNIDHATQVIRPPVDATDYEDTIALLAALDEIATVTTSIVHACGALGRSCHVLVPEVAQWRYAYRYGDGSEMIWYPAGSVTLYRQKPGETWEHPINRVANALKVAGKAKERSGKTARAASAEEVCQA